MMAPDDSEDLGAWVQDPQNPEVWFRVRPWANPAFLTALDLGFHKLAKEHSYTRVPDDAVLALTVSLVVRYILVDWRGLEFPFSFEGAMIMLSDRELGLLPAVVRCAQLIA